MSNLIVTNVCNLSCPFCFATELRVAQRTPAIQHMAAAEFGRLLAWLEIGQAHFCGGEPTLHPEFVELLEMALAAKAARILVMTNGLWPEKVRRHIAALAPRKAARVRFLFNVLEPDQYRRVQERHLAASLAVVNPYASTLGLTIYKHPFDFAYIIKLAKQYRIPDLRYSISAPNISNLDSWQLRPERDFRRLARTVYRFAMAARKAGLTLNSDCGHLPPCAFEPAPLSELQGTPVIATKCMSPVDIAAGGETWRCYGLYSVLRTTIDDTMTPAQLQGWFERRVRLLDDFVLFEECRDCSFRTTRRCDGGCYAIRVGRQLRRDPKTCLFPVDDDAQLLQCEPVFIGRLRGVFPLAPRRYQAVMEAAPVSGARVDAEVNDAMLRLMEGKSPGRPVREWLPELAGLFAAPADAERRTLRQLRSLFDQDLITFRRLPAA